MFNEGSKILFRVCLTLIKLHEDQLLRCTEFSEMAQCFKEITRSPSVLDCHQFMAVSKINKLKGSCMKYKQILFFWVLKAAFTAPGSLPSSKIDSLRARFSQASVGGSQKTTG